MRPVWNWLWSVGSPRSPVPLLAVAGAVIFWLILLRPIYDVDIFWQVKLGEITLNEGLPKNEPFLAGKQHEPLAVIAWLSQALYAAVKLVGGWPLLHLFDAVVWFAGFYVVAQQCAKQHGNDWPAIAGLLVAITAAFVHASLRPQSTALLCFGLLIVILRSSLCEKRKLILTMLLLVLWQNLHPSVIIGIGYLGARAAVGWLKALRFGERKPWLETGLTLFAVLATVMTPAGLGIFAISDYNQKISTERGISEWQTMWWWPTEFGRAQAWFAFHAFAVLIAFALVTRRRLKWLDLLPVLGLTAVSLYMHRFVIFWAVAVIPVFAELLARTPQPVAPNRWRWPLSVLLFAAVTVPVKIAEPASFCDYYPFEATDALKQSGFRGVIYSDYFWGGVLTEAGYPDWTVTHDGRYYLFTRDEWHRYNAVTTGQVPLDEIDRDHHPNAFVLMKGNTNDDGLIARLRGAWPVLFEDHHSIVFVKDLAKLNRK